MKLVLVLYNLLYRWENYVKKKLHVTHLVSGGVGISAAGNLFAEGVCLITMPYCQFSLYWF